MIQTPIEEYKLRGKTIYVKRDDLIGDGVIYPRWAKIEGIRKIFESDYLDDRPLAHLSVYGSWTGWVLSRLCKEYNIPFISAYPNIKDYPKEILEIVKSNGGELLPLKPNVLKVLGDQLRNLSKENNWQQLPYAFNHKDYVNNMQERMKEVLKDNDYDHLVVSTGSGVTASGLIREFLQYRDWRDLLNNKRKVHTVTMSTIKSTQNILNSNNAGDINNIHIYNPKYPFNDTMQDVMDYPFDMNEFWERKMWYWLDNNVQHLQGKILFWNIGGSYLDSF